MIFIGYPGIGKTTLASEQHSIFIDLKSEDFYGKNNSKRYDWYIPYCKVAEDLSKQGHFVFVSSHKEVRKQLEKTDEQVVTIIPSYELKDEWTKKLETRLINSPSIKNRRAYEHVSASGNFEKDIDESLKSPFPAIMIHKMDYKLKSLILDFTAVKSHYILTEENCEQVLVDVNPKIKIGAVLYMHEIATESCGEDLMENISLGIQESLSTFDEGQKVGNYTLSVYDDSGFEIAAWDIFFDVLDLNADPFMTKVKITEIIANY